MVRSESQGVRGMAKNSKILYGVYWIFTLKGMSEFSLLVARDSKTGRGSIPDSYGILEGLLHFLFLSFRIMRLVSQILPASFWNVFQFLTPFSTSGLISLDRYKSSVFSFLTYRKAVCWMLCALPAPIAFWVGARSSKNHCTASKTISFQVLYLSPEFFLSSYRDFADFVGVRFSS